MPTLCSHSLNCQVTLFIYSLVWLSRNRDFIGTFVLDEIATPERPLAQQVTYRTACGLGLEEETLDEHKRLRRQPKNRRTLGLEERERRSVPRVRHLLHAFAIKVLSSAYTPLTKTAKVCALANLC